MATKKAKAETRLFTLEDESGKSLAVNLTWKQVQDKITESLHAFLKREAKEFSEFSMSCVDATKKDSEDMAAGTCSEDWSEGICTEIYTSEQYCLPNFTIVEQCKLPERKVKFISFRK